MRRRPELRGRAHGAAWLLCAAGAVGCASTAPDPQRMADDLPPAAELSAAQRAVLDERVANALEAWQVGEFATARRTAADVLVDAPRHARARAVLGAALAAEAAAAAQPPALATWRRAEGELLRASRLAASDPVVTRLHADFLERDGHLSAAVARVERTLTGAGDAAPDIELLELAARLRFERGDEQRALDWTERVLAREPERPSALWRAAWCRARLGFAAALDEVERRRLLRAARDGFRTYRALRPEDADAYVGEARARLGLAEELAPGAEREAELTACVELWSAAALLEPEVADHPFGRGAAHELAGDTDAAEAAWREALAVDAAHLPALLNLAALLADSDRADAAVPLLRRALQLGPSDDERAAIEAWLRRRGSRSPNPRTGSGR